MCVDQVISRNGDRTFLVSRRFHLRVAASEFQKMQSRSYPSTVSGSLFMGGRSETNIVEDVLTLRVLALYQQGLIVSARFML